MSAAKKTFLIVQATVCFFALIGIVHGQTQAPADPELVGQLTKDLGVTPEQAKGGAGAILGLVKSKVSPAEFSKIAGAVPGMDGFLKAAPASQGGAGVRSLGSIGSGKFGGLASLAGSFQSLGLSPSMIGKFAPVLEKYVGAKGGSGAASLFSGALK
jgi:hypothetical protein